MPVHAAAIAAHPVWSALAALFLGGAGGAAGAAIASSAMKKPTDPSAAPKPALPASGVKGAGDLGAAGYDGFTATIYWSGGGERLIGTFKRAIDAWNAAKAEAFKVATRQKLLERPMANEPHPGTYATTSVLMGINAAWGGAWCHEVTGWRFVGDPPDDSIVEGVGAAAVPDVAPAPDDSAPGAASMDSSTQQPSVKQVGDWRRVANADLTPELVAAYRAQLREPVGTAKVVRLGGRRFLLVTVSKDEDPDLTAYQKDVRGWVRSAESKAVSLTVTLSGAEADDLSAAGDGNVSGETQVKDDLGFAIPIRAVSDEKKFALRLRRAEEGKFGIPVRGKFSDVADQPAEKKSDAKVSGEAPDRGDVGKTSRVDPTFAESLSLWSPTKVLPAAGGAYRTAFGPATAPPQQTSAQPNACPPCSAPTAPPAPQAPAAPSPPRAEASLRFAPPPPPPPPHVDAEASFST